jgi:hypothetical protein
MSSNNNGSGGVGFWGLLLLVFIVLKLLGFIAWSWVWVLSPFWIPLAVTLVVIVLVSVIPPIKGAS